MFTLNRTRHEQNVQSGQAKTDPQVMQVLKNHARVFFSTRGFDSCLNT